MPRVILVDCCVGASALTGGAAGGGGRKRERKISSILERLESYTF